jgi:hypothetical protein
MLWWVLAGLAGQAGQAGLAGLAGQGRRSVRQNVVQCLIQWKRYCDYGDPEGDCVWCAAQLEISNCETHNDQATPRHTHKMGESILQRLLKNSEHRFGETCRSVQTVTKYSKH